MLHQRIRNWKTTLPLVLAVGSVLAFVARPQPVEAATVTISTNTTWDTAAKVTLNDGDNLVINANVTLTVGGAGSNFPIPANGQANTITVNGTLQIKTGQGELHPINAQGVVINTGGKIDATGTGFAASKGPGAGKTGADDAGSGGGHGGPGGNTGQVLGGKAYGSVDAPLTPGSGGGGQCNTPTQGGPGGGVVHLNLSNSLINNGTIQADGGVGLSSVGCTNNNRSRGGGGGGGGSLYIQTANLEGNGIFQAVGGDGKQGRSAAGAGGGGGHIAIYYNNNTYNRPLTEINVNGGTGPGNAQEGKPGTILLVDNNGTATESNDDDAIFLKSVRFHSDVNADLTYKTITFQNTDIVFDDAGEFTFNAEGGNIEFIGSTTSEDSLRTAYFNVLSGTFHMDGASRLGINARVNARDVTIDAGANIDATGDGNAPAKGTGAGITTGVWANSGGSGASYGGKGGNANEANARNVYGNSYAPNAFPLNDEYKGSGGGGSCGVDNSGGFGGGAVRITVTNTFTLNGDIQANGMNGSLKRCGNNNQSDNGGGGGSGGSIMVNTKTLRGNGFFAANGGDGFGNGSGGGGGRAAIYFDDAAGYARPLADSSVNYGNGWQTGQVGTMIFVDDQVSSATQDDEIHFVSGFHFRTSEGTEFTYQKIFFDGVTATLENNEALTLTATGDEVLFRNSTVSGDYQKNLNLIAEDAVVTFVESTLLVNISMRAHDLDVGVNSRIDVTGFGERGGAGIGKGANGPNPRAGTGAGAGYGGKGGNGGGGSLGGAIYGSTDEEKRKPLLSGSGGGNACNAADSGGAGGGVIQLDVKNILTVNGTIIADGDTGGSKRCGTGTGTDRGAGGGSGGSISVFTAIANGNANNVPLIISGGGEGGVNKTGGGGAGGRIGFCVDQNNLPGNTFEVLGGAGLNNGGNGEVYFCTANYLIQETDIQDWAWLGWYLSDNSVAVGQGWLSTSCVNTASCGVNNTDYGLKARIGANPDGSGDLEGFAWLGQAAADGGARANSIGFVNFDPAPFSSSGNVRILSDGRVVGSTFFFTKTPSATEGDVGKIVDDGGTSDPADDVITPWGEVRFGPEEDKVDDAGNWGSWAHFNWSSGVFTDYGWGGGMFEDVGGSANTESSGFGLLSLNCSQTGRDDTCSTSNYRVYAKDGDGDGNLKSETIVDLHGFAWFGGLDDEALGWVSFNCADRAGANVCNTSPYKVQMNTVTGVLSGQAWVGNVSDDNGLSPVGWLDFGAINSNGYPAAPDKPASFDPDTGLVYGWAQITSIYDYGVNQFGEDDWGWIKLGDKTTEPVVGTDMSNPSYDPRLKNSYGVRLDAATGNLYGFAWSGGAEGVGFIDFDGLQVQVEPFIQTLGGDVYAGGGIQAANPAPEGINNATFLILSGGNIQNFTTEGRNAEPNESNDPGPVQEINENNVLGLAKTGSVYHNVLGKIDLDAITAKVDGNKNALGNDVVEVTSGTLSGDFAMNGKVFSSNGPLTVSGLTLRNGTGTEAPANDGSGLIVVRGDLTIDGNIAYESVSNLEHVYNLASVGFIVEGNININGGVDRLDGAFIALGGNINTGSGNTQLKVKGLMMAKSFTFGRNFADSAHASELITYDGRLLANTPTGLQDFAALVPDIRKISR
ncbi:MAG: hypothetical protein A3F54_00620 [Candidatus Kerfeldbacteria bacterium RIFCSPHIGHO2_12_FULL_48_17]|uniref:Uncharacterized protein n=1 Tax=Candidatus Kerfeldbacteria bacterium RIFCSPHIGHO2_12_FULL_48_17 TaxID=1798542 RepID=A0A1G2B876_9BACT|nr:MAG: hypothetical protein A3F54_00620 [Candidatus Kerfeldbacteria bacterium RIFCSPHIGHO2_12_FULL_48_17]